MRCWVRLDCQPMNRDTAETSRAQAPTNRSSLCRPVRRGRGSGVDMDFPKERRAAPGRPSSRHGCGRSAGRLPEAEIVAQAEMEAVLAGVAALVVDHTAAGEAEVRQG